MGRKKTLTEEQRIENRRESKKAYKAENIKRIPLDVQQEEYERIRKAAEAEGIGVNTWVKAAIRERLGAGQKVESAEV